MLVSKHPVDGMSRREFMAKLAAASSAGAMMSLAGPVIEKAYGAGPCSGHLTDIEHFVFMLQENRSFDHYFGSLSGINGFDTPSSAFQQKGWNPQTQSIDPAGVTIPYRFDTTRARCSTAHVPTTPATNGSTCTGRSTTVPTTIGWARRPKPRRCKATSR